MPGVSETTHKENKSEQAGQTRKVETIQKEFTKRTKQVGIAVQGGVFPAGAMAAGAIKYLVEAGAFNDPECDINTFSGTSSGALVASVCWGHKMMGKMHLAPEVLEKQWLHNAVGLIPNATIARSLIMTDEICRTNPIYDFVAQNVFVRMQRAFLENWVKLYVRPDEMVAIRDAMERDRVPTLALGTTNVLTGEPKVITEWEFCLPTLLASGSLDECNGLTTIETGDCAGTYCDGAWGTNPPINFLLSGSALEKKIDELWLLEIWPKVRAEVPRSLVQRKDRKNELWQNSLVEHEIGEIERVNDWLEDGTIATGGKYKHIEIRRMPMTLDLEPGAEIVNTPSFIREMMAYGYSAARSLYIPKPSTKARKEPPEPHAKKAA